MSATLSLPVQVQGLEKLGEQRQAAFKRLGELSFPTQKDEVWRRTDPENVKPENQVVVAPVSHFGMLDGGAVPAKKKKTEK